MNIIATKSMVTHKEFIVVFVSNSLPHTKE